MTGAKLVEGMGGQSESNWGDEVGEEEEKEEEVQEKDGGKRRDSGRCHSSDLDH